MSADEVDEGIDYLDDWGTAREWLAQHHRREDEGGVRRQPQLPPELVPELEAET